MHLHFRLFPGERFQTPAPVPSQPVLKARVTALPQLANFGNTGDEEIHGALMPSRSVVGSMELVPPRKSR
jgi:hypothetical protein